jgi:hypothetical protein
MLAAYTLLGGDKSPLIDLPAASPSPREG